MAQYGAMFLLEMAFASRGRERMDFYTKDDFKILMDEDNNLRYWKLVTGGETKNHKMTNQDMEKGGRIYFKKNSAGLNPGEYFQDFMSKLNPESKNLMQHPQRPKKTFKLEDNPKIW